MQTDKLISTDEPDLPVAVEAMGGDSGCLVAIKGALKAAREADIASILVGDEGTLSKQLKSLGAFSNSLIGIQHAPEVISMDESPSLAIRGKTSSSICVAFELIKEGRASSVLSAGNTGAVMAAGVASSGTLPGIGRPAIASLIPRAASDRPVILLDSGANIDCHAPQLVQFALMGSRYASSALLCHRPRVALLSNGTEISKGNDIIRSAAYTLSELEEIEFVGYVEGRDISRDIADVVVCDGFIGNIVLKAMEGSVELVFDSIKTHIKGTLRGRLGMWLAKPMLYKLFHKQLDPSSYGGAPLLGLNAIAVISHGSSDERAFFNGIRIADKFAKEKLVEKLRSALFALDEKLPEGYEDSFWDRFGSRFDRKKRVRLKRAQPDSTGQATVIDIKGETNDSST